MARYFPIFIDLGGSPPLVVGARPALAAKLRLLAGFAPQTDLLTGLQALPPDLDLPGVRHISGMPLDRARFSHPYGSWNRDPSQIIAEEIHDHVKFSGILHAVEQFIGITIARTRPLDGTRQQLIAAANEK